jgi:phosphoglucomutase
MASTATGSVVELPTTPIPGMKPGTSGLRKKVEIWQGVEEANKYYVENFIQSLLDTATAKNDGVMPHTYVT